MEYSSPVWGFDSSVALGLGFYMVTAQKSFMKSFPHHLLIFASQGVWCQVVDTY